MSPSHTQAEASISSRATIRLSRMGIQDRERAILTGTYLVNVRKTWHSHLRIAPWSDLDGAQPSLDPKLSELLIEKSKGLFD